VNKTIIIIALFVIITTITYAKIEKDYQEYFADIIFTESRVEFVLADKTRVDILTKDYAIEVDYIKKMYEAVGQAIYYSLMTGKQPAIVFILPGNNVDQKHLDRALVIIDDLNNHGYEIIVWTIDYNDNIKRVR